MDYSGYSGQADQEEEGATPQPVHHGIHFLFFFKDTK
jgi:hypothetical protein